MIDNSITVQILLALVAGSTFVNAIRRSGNPCRVRIPNDLSCRAELINTHTAGEPAVLTFYADGRDPWQEEVDAVALAAFCPDADGGCRWIGIDLDAPDHGENGLADPVHAMRTIAERADATGLSSGLIAARSRRGQGRHLFLILPEPVPLTDAVIGLAALTAAAFKIATSDADEHLDVHAFRSANGAIARPGDAGAVELLPRSTTRPPHGWALALPAAGASRSLGGGIIVDAFNDKPIQHECIPRCDPEAWRRLVTENRQFLTRIEQGQDRSRPCCTEPTGPHRLHPLTEEFLLGQTPTGRRNASAFAAACNLLGTGQPLPEVERQIVDGARCCELPESEARRAVQSARRAMEKSQ